MSDAEDPPANMPPLGETGRDRALQLGKGLVGAIPGVGSIIAETIGQLIPQQRLERVEDYIRRLNERLAELEEAELRLATTPEGVDLFEEGAHQVARAVSEARREYIAKLVADGLPRPEREQLEAKRVLRLLGELDDAQVIILASYLHKNQSNDYAEKHQDVLDRGHVSLGSSAEDAEKYTVNALGRSELLRLGLLEKRHSFLKKGQIPEFEKNGELKGGHVSITALGRLLLARIGLANSGEF